MLDSLVSRFSIMIATILHDINIFAAREILWKRGCNGRLRLFTIYKYFRKVGLESKLKTTLWVVPAENYQKQRKIRKGSPVFPDGMFQTGARVPFPKTVFDNSLKPSRPF